MTSHLPTKVQPQVTPLPGKVGRYTNKIHYLKKNVIDKLPSKQYALDFLTPVDAKALGVPNYYGIIKNPMDVGTISKRVHNLYYYQVDEMIQDFQLVIANCYTFNRPGLWVYRNCQKLEKFFYQVLIKMPSGEEKPSPRGPRQLMQSSEIKNSSMSQEKQAYIQITESHSVLPDLAQASIASGLKDPLQLEQSSEVKNSSMHQEEQAYMQIIESHSMSPDLAQASIASGLKDPLQLEQSSEMKNSSMHQEEQAYMQIIESHSMLPDWTQASTASDLRNSSTFTQGRVSPLAPDSVLWQDLDISNSDEEYFL